MQRVQLERNILCFSWNAACDQVAVSPHTNELHIYAVPSNATTPARWQRLHTFSDHDLVVSGVHWGPQRDRIATCSHDRNVFVYVRSSAGSGWQQQLVRTRVGKAALCVQWSPSEAKLAVGSSDSGLHVCHYDEGSRWWVARAIKGRHTSSLVALAWHPSLPLVATASTDGTCRLFTAAIPEVDGRPAPGAPSGFGQQVWEARPDGSWVHGVAWHPDGTWLATCTHAARVHLFRDPAGAPRPSGQADAEVAVEGLPLKALLFTREGVLGGGWGGTVHLLRQEAGEGGGEGGWVTVALEPGAGAAVGTTQPAAVGAVGGMGQEQRVGSRVAGMQQELRLQQLSGTRSAPSSPRARCDAVPTASTGIKTCAGHSKCIVGLTLVPGASSTAGACLQVCSAGLDGQLLFWRLPS